MFRFVSVILFAAAAFLGPSPALAQNNPLGSSCKVSGIRPQGQTPSAIEGRPNNWIWTFTGSPVVITCDDSVLQADVIKYNDFTEDIEASGNVLLQQRDLNLSAERAEMNGKTKLGVFHNASGIARVGDAPAEKSPFGTLESDALFHGERIEKSGPSTYQIHHGAFTTCAQPTPRWEMTMGDATITLDKHAILRNVVLKVKDVPLFYLPALYYPLKKEDRSTGFLLPTYGASTVRGNTLSNAFFLAVSRSQDATFYHDWTSKSGQGFGAEYRYVQSPGSRGTANFFMTDSPTIGADGSIESVGGVRTYQIDGDANQGLPRGFRLIARMNYFTDIKTQQLYQDVFESDQRQQRTFVATVSGNIGRTRLTATAEQRDYFYPTSRGETKQRSGRLPAVNINIPDRAIGQSRVYVGGVGQIGYLVAQQDLSDPLTDRSLWRIDGGPSIRAPLSSLSFLSATAQASWRLTYWGESYDLTDLDDPVQVPTSLTRQLLELKTDVTGPVFSRVFPQAGIKHLIEPRVSISRTTSFAELSRVVQFDGVDRMVGGVTRVDYGLINRIMKRRGLPSATGRSAGTREIMSVSIGQSYYTNAEASRYDSQQDNLGTNAVNFSPINVRVSVRPTDLANADFRMDIDAKYRAVRTMSAAARFEMINGDVAADWSLRRVIPGLPGFSVARHALSGATTLRTRDNHLGGGYRFSYDLQEREWVHQRIMAYYNSQCCGVSFDWQKSSTPLWTPQGIPTNTQFGISFTLAGIGSFSNPLGSFGGR